MPISGGAADKLGNRYELSWTIWQFVRILRHELDSLRIEDPNFDKAEFVAYKNGIKELHQAKRSNLNGKWTLSSLAESGTNILQAIFDQLNGNDDTFVFVSSSDSPELRELSERARASSSIEEFESEFINSIQRRSEFEKLIQYWRDNKTAFNILRRTFADPIGERHLEELIDCGIRALFLADPNLVINELRSLAENSIHKLLERDSIIGHLKSKGFSLRRITGIESAMVCVKKATQQYLDSVRGKLIRKNLLPRSTTEAFLEKLDGQNFAGDFVILGKAGTGKTGCVIDLVDSLKARNIPVLAFRLDRLEPTTASFNIGKQIGLEESPPLVLAAVAEGRESVLLIDQLDAVSTISGRSSAFFDAVESMLEETRGLRHRANIHVVVVCRNFDWDNDHRLRRLLHKENVKLEVSEFTSDEVKGVLKAEGFDPNLFQARQLSLLGLPQNLSLFLESGFSSSAAPRFNSAKELFDRYWNEKRRAVGQRTTPSNDQWSEIISTICNEMTNTQQLSVIKEKLDHFNPDYINQMASEGVLTFDGQRYGFGHESFFDYCFARAFLANSQTLMDSITQSEQHLFRRAQVRQVLAYLRDAAPDRYLAELKNLLTCPDVRFHIKDIALTLLFAVPNPTEDEWKVVEPYFQSEVKCFSKKQTNPDRFSRAVWNHFHMSESWFKLADQLNYIENWISSDDVGVCDMVANYLRYHQRIHGDRVAELLESNIGKSDAWNLRLCYIIEWADLEVSRDFFDLFLSLIDDGTLDEARGPIAQNSTFWSMLYGISKSKPSWISEVLAHWLRRRFNLLTLGPSKETKLYNLFGSDSFGRDPIKDAAKADPRAFLQNILPVILDISEFDHKGGHDTLPKYDPFSPIRFPGKHENMESACINGLKTALEKLAIDKPEEALEKIEDFRKRQTYISNFFLLNLLKANPSCYADLAVSIICNEPWRFKCGYSDSSYWISRQLITAVTPHCSSAQLQVLQKTILDFYPRYERTKQGRKLFGSTKFELLSAIPPQLRDTATQARYEELERKFDKPRGEPHGVQGGFVPSPISKEAAKKMTDSQWLSAIKKHNSDWPLQRWQGVSKGGAGQLANVLEAETKTNPDRFAKLCTLFPPSSHAAYTNAILRGLSGTDVESNLKLSVCFKAFTEFRQACGKDIANLISSMGENLPDDAIEILKWLAVEDPDPEIELWDPESTDGKPYYGGSIHDHGINTTRGRAAEAIAALIEKDETNISIFEDTINQLTNDQSLGVRACVGKIIIALSQYDLPKAFHLLERLVDLDDRLLTTSYIDHFVYWSISENYDNIAALIKRMIRSQVREANERGSCFAGLSVLHGNPTSTLVEEALLGNESHRLGIAQVASANIKNADCRAWCEKQLLVLFYDSDEKVRTEAGTCFSYLTTARLSDFELLFTEFAKSPAYEDNSFDILHLLEKTLQPLPGLTCEICESFLERFSDEANDIRTRKASESRTISNLIFRIYHQHQNSKWGSKCLDLIDSMRLAGIQDVRNDLDRFDR